MGVHTNTIRGIGYNEKREYNFDIASSFLLSKKLWRTQDSKINLAESAKKNLINAKIATSMYFRKKPGSPYLSFITQIPTTGNTQHQ